MTVLPDEDTSVGLRTAIEGNQRGKDKAFNEAEITCTSLGPFCLSGLRVAELP